MTVSWDGDLARSLARAGIRDGLEAGAELVLQESDKLVPYQSGALEESGAVTRFTETTYVVSYARHPILAHEDLTFHHKHGQAKYLETALNANSAEVLDLIAAAVTERLA